MQRSRRSVPRPEERLGGVAARVSRGCEEHAKGFSSRIRVHESRGRLVRSEGTHAVWGVFMGGGGRGGLKRGGRARGCLGRVLRTNEGWTEGGWKTGWQKRESAGAVTGGGSQFLQSSCACGKLFYSRARAAPPESRDEPPCFLSTLSLPS